MIKNCFLFNPVGTPVQIAGADLQRLFEDKWKNLPPLREITESEDEEDSEDDDRQREFPANFGDSYWVLTDLFRSNC
jgi:bromodomain-containing factor 1